MFHSFRQLLFCRDKAIISPKFSKIANFGKLIALLYARRPNARMVSIRQKGDTKHRFSFCGDREPHPPKSGYSTVDS